MCGGLTEVRVTDTTKHLGETWKQRYHEFKHRHTFQASKKVRRCIAGSAVSTKTLVYYYEIDLVSQSFLYRRLSMFSLSKELCNYVVVYICNSVIS